LRTLTPRSGSAFGLASAYFLRDSILTHPTHPAQSTSCLRQKWRCPLCTRLGPLWAALPVFYFCLFQYSVSSSPRAIKTKTSAYGVALGFSHFLLSGVARSGGRSFFSAPALFFFSLFARRSAEMRFAQSANAKTNKTESAKMVEIGRFQLQNSFFFAFGNRNRTQSQTLRFSTRAK